MGVLGSRDRSEDCCHVSAYPVHVGGAKFPRYGSHGAFEIEVSEASKEARCVVAPRRITGMYNQSKWWGAAAASMWRMQRCGVVWLVVSSRSGLA